MALSVNCFKHIEMRMSQIIQLEHQGLVYKVPCKMLKQLPLKTGLVYFLFVQSHMSPGGPDTLSKLPHDPLSSFLIRYLCPRQLLPIFFFSSFFLLVRRGSHFTDKTQKDQSW